VGAGRGAEARLFLRTMTDLSQFDNSWYFPGRSRLTQVLWFFLGSVSSLASRSPGQPTKMKTKVQTTIISLDTQINSGVLPTPNVLKIDVEGWEMEVLLGMKSLIQKRAPALVLELAGGKNPRQMPNESLAFLKSLADYVFYRLDDDPRVHSCLTALDSPRVASSGNYLAILKDDVDCRDRIEPFLTQTVDAYVSQPSRPSVFDRNA